MLVAYTQVAYSKIKSILVDKLLCWFESFLFCVKMACPVLFTVLKPRTQLRADT